MNNSSSKFINLWMIINYWSLNVSFVDNSVICYGHIPFDIVFLKYLVSWDIYHNVIWYSIRWKRKGFKWYWIKKKIELFHIHPLNLLLQYSKLVHYSVHWLWLFDAAFQSYLAGKSQELHLIASRITWFCMLFYV